MLGRAIGQIFFIKWIDLLTIATNILALRPRLQFYFSLLFTCCCCCSCFFHFFTAQFPHKQWQRESKRERETEYVKNAIEKKISKNKAKPPLSSKKKMVWYIYIKWLNFGGYKQNIQQCTEKRHTVRDVRLVCWLVNWFGVWNAYRQDVFIQSVVIHHSFYIVCVIYTFSVCYTFYI